MIWLPIQVPLEMKNHFLYGKATVTSSTLKGRLALEDDYTQAEQ